jgi:hypothetical protein
LQVKASGTLLAPMTSSHEHARTEQAGLPVSYVLFPDEGRQAGIPGLPE